MTGWGEVTTTTPTANRAIAAVLRQCNDLLEGADRSAIERIWHQVFRSFTYSGSRGIATTATSAVDIALWDIRGKVLGLPVADLLGGRVREDLPLYTHPRSQMYRSREAIAEEIGRIVASGHDAIKGPAASAS